jgi:hypothetical protein
LLKGLLAPYSRNLTTPHLLAEVSNLADQCVPKRQHREFREHLCNVVTQLDERWTEASTLCTTDAFQHLGLADSGICYLADERTKVLSVDAELCGLLWGMGIDAENFNHLRDD